MESIYLEVTESQQDRRFYSGPVHSAGPAEAGAGICAGVAAPKGAPGGQPSAVREGSMRDSDLVDIS